MRTRIATAAAAFSIVVMAVAGQAPAEAHQGNPNFRSTVNAVDPSTPGVDAEVVNLDDRLVLTSSGHTVEVEGYRNEPYARILPDGAVQLNKRSPAYYLNEDRFAAVEVPSDVDPEAAPDWETFGSSGRLEFHDHRIHWMAQGTPPQITNESERTKVFDWKVPIVVDGNAGAVTGDLYWVPDEGGFPIAAVIGLVAFALLAIAFVLVVRRRRTGEGGGGPEEAW